MKDVVPVDVYRETHKKLNEQSRSKYNNRKVVVDGHEFPSQGEADRYGELLLMDKADEIHDLRLQPVYLLQEAFTDEQGRKHKKIEYVADFEYFQREPACKIVEDFKGMKTDVYRIKKKLFIKKYPAIEFRETKKA